MPESDSTAMTGPRLAHTPSPELIRLADALNGAVVMFLEARRGIGVGQWEAPRAAWALSNVLVRNIEAVALMARTDQSMVVAAWPNARVAFEHSVRILWLLYPPDRFASEGRWLGMMAEEEKFNRLVAEAAERDPDGVRGREHRNREAALRDFRSAVTDKLPSGYEMEKPPAFEQMLRSVGGEKLYRYYREGSQFVHGSLWAASTYQRHLGTKAQYGDFSTAADWILPMRLCWLSLRHAGDFVLDRLPHVNSRALDWEAVAADIDLKFTDLARTMKS